MPRRILMVSPEKCTGCRLCEAACSLYRDKRISPHRARITIVDFTTHYIPVVCMHCDDPACMEACPANAIYRDRETGAVIINYDLCMGCRSCMIACPFGAISWSEREGRVVKCDLCNGDPQCARVCSRGAIEYVSPDRVHLDKRLEAARKLEELMRKYVMPASR
jgi:Fe-S-cluster-containing hydrogenase component 2